MGGCHLQSHLFFSYFSSSFSSFFFHFSSSFWWVVLSLLLLLFFSLSFPRSFLNQLGLLSSSPNSSNTIASWLRISLFFDSFWISFSASTIPLSRKTFWFSTAIEG